MATITYTVKPYLGGFVIDVYEVKGWVATQFHYADDGRRWKRKKDAQRRAKELQAEPQPSYEVKYLCCLACGSYSAFTNFRLPVLTCLTCSTPAIGHEHTELAKVLMRQRIQNPDLSR